MKRSQRKIDLEEPGRRGKVGRHSIRQQIREMVLSGQLPPGSKLHQQRLAAQFNCAQGLVREALLELKGTGLVETIDNLGVYVADLNLETVIEAYTMREVLEGLASRLCCQRASRADLAELEGIAERQYRIGPPTASSAVHQAAVKADQGFHRRILDISGHKMIRQAAEQYHILDAMSVYALRSREVTRADHLCIVRAIAENRPDDAEVVAREHVASARRVLEERAAAGVFVLPWQQGKHAEP